MAVEASTEVVPTTADAVHDLDPSDALVAIGNEVLANGPSSTTVLEQSGSATPSSGASVTDEDRDSIRDNDDDADNDVFQDAMDDLPATKKLHQRLSLYSPQIRESEEWEQIMQDWDRVMAEKRIQDAKLNLVEQENKRMKAQLADAELTRTESDKENLEKIAALEVANKDLLSKNKNPAKEKLALQDQLEESEAEKELFKLMLEETEGEKKRVEMKLIQVEKEREDWNKKTEKIQALKNRLRLKAAQYQLLSASTSSLLAQGLDGIRPDKERRRLMDQVTSLESDRSRLAAMVKDTMNSTGDVGSDSATADVSTLSSQDLVHENTKLNNELQMTKVECSLLQHRIEALEVTLHDVRVALTNSEAHSESLEMKKYDLQDKLAAAEGGLDRSRIESTKYQGLHKEMLEKNEKIDREMQIVKARFEAKDRVLVTTQKQLTAAKADGGLLKTIRRELESVLFDYNTVVQHFMDIQVQAIGAKSLANSLKRKNNELQAQLTHFRSMLLGIKSFNNNDPIKSPTVTTLRSEFRVLLEKLQEEQNAQVERERNDKGKAQDWNRKLRMEKDFMKLELQNQIEKWRRVSIYWEDKWRKTANDLHEAVTTGATSDVLFEIASGHPGMPLPGAVIPTSSASAATSPRSSHSLSANGAQSKRRSLAISTLNGIGHHGGHDQPMTPSAMKQHILESKMRSGTGTGSSASQSRPNSMLFHSSANLASPTNGAPVTAISSPPLATSPSTATLAVGAITESITDLVSTVKPFLSRTISQTSSTTSSLVGAVGTGRGGQSAGALSPSSRLAASASLRTPIAAGLPSNVRGMGAMGNTAVSKTSIRSRSMATSAIGTARSQALQAGVSGSEVTLASRDAQTRASSSISTVTRSVDQALSESDRLKADVRRMLNR
ncbi:hypothetical protein BG011_001193 [Mortierella polycephala]|uniref:Uncharacterized protein n=1 Tax=Mortierella polycephala TaxID=41804 RepID=A0A9P6QFH3_9FUNG|nr:hypothetical protein BG011_001193 [Mortierella polycephala]